MIVVLHLLLSSKEIRLAASPFNAGDERRASGATSAGEQNHGSKCYRL